MTAGRNPIVCWLKTDAEGGIEITSRGDTRKKSAADGGWQNGRRGDQQRT